MQFGGHGKILRIRRAAPQDSALCTQGRGASDSQQHALGTAAREGGPGTYKRGVGIVVLRKTEAPLRAAQARVVARAPHRGRIGRVQQPHLVPRGVVLLGVVGHRVPWRHRRSLPLRPTTPSAQLKKTTASAHTVQHSIRPKRGAPHARTHARTHARGGAPGARGGSTLAKSCWRIRALAPGRLRLPRGPCGLDDTHTCRAASGSALCLARRGAPAPPPGFASSCSFRTAIISDCGWR